MLVRRAGFAALFLLLAGVLGAQPQNQLDASKSLFTVLAALDAAGESPDANSPSNHPLRKAIRDHIQSQRLASVRDLREFFRQHRQDSPAATMRLYITYGLLTEGPPEFKPRMRVHELPPDVASIVELAPLLRKFSAEANIDDLWQRSQPAIEQALARYQPGVIKTIQETSGYLRAPLSGGYMGRNFQIFVDLLGAPNQVHFATFLDDYFLVVTHSAEPQIDEVRQAWLHFLIDPMATKYSEKINEKKALAEFAQAAPALAQHFKDDFLLLATRSLIRAVEARMAYGAAAKQKIVDQAMAEGFILTAHFFEQLPAYEKQEQAMRLYFPDLIASINMKQEDKRLEKIQFASERAVKVIAPPPPPEAPVLTGVDKTLDDAEELYRKRDLGAARELFLKALSESDAKPVQAKAYYGLARIAALNRDPELAEKLFTKTLELGPEAPVKAWSLVYLARLSEAAGEREPARKLYQEALNVEGASDAARKAAEQGLTKKE